MARAMPVISIRRPRKTNGKQDQVAHALVHSSDHHDVGRAGCQGEIADRGEAKCKRDRHGRKDHRADHENEEDQKIQIAKCLQDRRQQNERSDDACDDRQGGQQAAQARDADEPEDGCDQHQPDADRQRCRTPGVDDLERRSGDEGLVGGEFIGRPNDEHEKCQRRRGRYDIQERAELRTEHADDGGHPHVLAALERNHRPEHGEPEEENAGKLVGPDDRRAEYVSAHDARGQHHDLRQHEQGRRDCDSVAKHHVRCHHPSARIRLRSAGREPGIHMRRMAHAGHDSWPAAFSR
ncbi:hypothetical protein ABIF86_000679 [Bradyrhizobium japonicum]